jgi:hypothetical protein
MRRSILPRRASRSARGDPGRGRPATKASRAARRPHAPRLGEGQAGLGHQEQRKRHDGRIEASIHEREVRRIHDRHAELAGRKGEEAVRDIDADDRCARCPSPKLG